MTATNVDPITLEVMRNGFYSIADEMIAALIRASYSTNIKDRRGHVRRDLYWAPEKWSWWRRARSALRFILGRCTPPF